MTWSNMNSFRQRDSNQRDQEHPQSIQHSQSLSSKGEEEDEWLVSCRCESAQAVATLLACLREVSSSGNFAGGERSAHSKSQNNINMSSVSRVDLTQRGNRRRSTAADSIQPVTVFCSPTSLTFHVYGKAKQTQASVDMQAGLFTDYQVSSTRGDGNNNPEEDWQAGGEFCVNLSTVLECLYVLGTNHLEKTKLCFSYNLTTDIFKMELLEESGVLSTSAIPGMLPPEEGLGNSLALAFRSSPIAARIIVKSDSLLSVVSELELVAGGTYGTVALTATAGLEMAVVGHLGECMIQVPAKGNHVVSLEVQQNFSKKTSNGKSTKEGMSPTLSSPSAHKYPLHSLLRSMRGLEIAQETCITVNNIGMMAIQHQVIESEVGDGNPNFVDFIMCCLEDDDEEHTDDEHTANGNEQEEAATAGNGASQNSSSSSPTSAFSVSSIHRGRHSAGKVTQYSGQRVGNDGDGNDEESDTELTSVSAAPLFGRVVRDSSSGSPMSRSVRRRLRRPVGSRSSYGSRSYSRRSGFSNDDDADSDGNASRNLLESDNSDKNGDDELEEEEETQPLDVTACASPRSEQRHREECASPELVYG